MSLRVAALAAVLLSARVAGATDVEIVAVLWAQDTSPKSEVDDFFRCLTESSTFGSTWAQEFGLSKVTFRGVYTLSDPCPSPAYQAGNLLTTLTGAFDKGTLPKPSAGGTSYLLYLPSGVQGYDQTNLPACQNTYCGVHGVFDYQGTSFDIALVPIQCADCPGVQVTLIGEHEAAEAIANMGTAQYEVGDSCEGPSNETMLSCCGKQYPIQQLSSSQSQGDCQTISATGGMCWCAPVQTACTQSSACCPGMSCAAVAKGGEACCVAAGGACAQAGDCCGAQACSAGKCACVPDGAACVGDADCCGGKCSGGACGLPDMAMAAPDLATAAADLAIGGGAGGGNDAGAGGGGGGGNGGVGSGGGGGGGGAQTMGGASGCGMAGGASSGVELLLFGVLAVLGLGLRNRRGRTLRRGH
jgi:hypothetical protein